jgi:peptide/nickel transport system permease protein
MLFFVALAIFSFVYLPHSPLRSVGPDYSPPSSSFPFGTTNIGQDVLSEWMYGSRATLLVGLLTAIIATTLGTVSGIVAGFIRITDEPLMRVADIVLTLPTLPLLIVIAAFVRPSIVLVSALIAFLSWPLLARVLRSNVLTLREMSFVDIALLSGVPKLKIMFNDMIRHLLPLILAYSMFAVIGAILAEAALDFIGVGPITEYSWGAMISYAEDNSAMFNGAWWWVLVPGISIAIFSTGMALAAYALEDTYKEGVSR